MLHPTEAKPTLVELPEAVLHRTEAKPNQDELPQALLFLLNLHLPKTLLSDLDLPGLARGPYGPPDPLLQADDAWPPPHRGQAYPGRAA